MKTCQNHPTDLIVEALQTNLANPYDSNCHSSPSKIDSLLPPPQSDLGTTTVQSLDSESVAVIKQSRLIIRVLCGKYPFENGAPNGFSMTQSVLDSLGGRREEPGLDVVSNCQMVAHWFLSTSNVTCCDVTPPPTGFHTGFIRKPRTVIK